MNQKDIEAVIKEFHEMMLAKEYVSKGGMDYAKAILMKTLSPDKAKRLIDRMQKSIESTSGFETLSKIDPVQLSKMIQKEHPQTVALILSNLDPGQAAESLASFPSEMQYDVAYRMATLKDISPDVVRQISQKVESKIESMSSYNTGDVGGVVAIAEVFNRMDRSVGSAILEKMEEVDPTIAGLIKDRMFVFDDIVFLDERAIQEILKRTDNKTLTVALKGVDDDLKEKFFKNMSKRAVEMIKEEMEFMGPVRVREVEGAQHKLVEIVRKLEEEGTVVLGGASGEDFI